MKKIFVLIVCVLIFVVVFVGIKANNTTQKSNNEYLRIHIRANSNSESDQSVKYKVKEKVVEFLTPILSSCTTKELAISAIQRNESEIALVADNVLHENGYNYTSNIKINNEYFPTRCYNDITLDSGFYDAVIVELGAAQGDNWWCVVYPPLCFSDFEYGKNIVYKSKIIEIINDFFK